MCMKQMLRKSNPFSGVWAPRKHNRYPEIKSDGFWQLADYPTLVFHFNTKSCKCSILEQESLSFKVLMA